VVVSVCSGWWVVDFLCNEEEKMSNKQDDGGPAFPCSEWPEHGMSLRDYFAARAMAAVLSLEMVHNKMVHNNAGETEIAVWAYAQADAMLEIRKE